MDRYHVLLKPKALEDIDNIYEYIAMTLHNSDATVNLLDEFEATITSLEELPFRGLIRKIGMFANKGYRQVFTNNFTLIHRVDQMKRQVVIVHVVYSKRDF